MYRWSELGAALKTLREEKDLSQPQVVAESRAYERADSLSRVESGARRPGRQALLRILVNGLHVREVPKLDEILRLARYAQISKDDLERDPLRNIAEYREPSFASGSTNAAEVEKPLDLELKHELLKLHYSDQSLREHGLFRFSFSVNGQNIRTSIATKRTWLGLGVAIDERDHDRFPLQPRKFSWPSTPFAEEKKLRDELEKRGIAFHNKPIYCLQAFASCGKQLSTFSLGQYVDYKIKLGRLEEEIANALRDSDDNPRVAFRMRTDRMRLRNELLPDCRTISSLDRLCAGGTNVLLAFRKPEHDGFVFFVKRRSRGVSTGRQLFSLLPSGMHQPTNKANAPFETSIAATVYRETYEELFGGREVEGEDQHIAPLWFMSKPPLKWITAHRDEVVTDIVSFGLNLVDGTYEFGVLVVINDDEYWATFQEEMQPNREFDDSETPYFSTLGAGRLESLLLDPYLADTSLIALVEGLRRLSTLYPTRVSLPDIKILVDT